MSPASRDGHQLVVLHQDWVVADVWLHMRETTLGLPLGFVGDYIVCPECGTACSMKDHAAERNWRHLDAMQFQAILTARGCCSGERSGLKTIAVPLVQQQIRFTLLF